MDGHNVGNICEGDNFPRKWERLASLQPTRMDKSKDNVDIKTRE